MGKLEDIKEGWMNRALKTIGKADPEVEKRAAERLQICDNCEVRTAFICDPMKTTTHVKTGERVKGCGCALTAKVRAEKSECPAGKW